MKRIYNLAHEFVEFIPQELKDKTIYVCIMYGTVVHKCCCGCGNEVVTPLSPTDWELTFDGESISLYPSIGNWGFECQSHYWIRRNKVKWAGRLSQKEIEIGRTYDKYAKERYFDKNKKRLISERNENAWMLFGANPKKDPSKKLKK